MGEAWEKRQWRHCSVITAWEGRQHRVGGVIAEWEGRHRCIEGARAGHHCSVRGASLRRGVLHSCVRGATQLRGRGLAWEWRVGATTLGDGGVTVARKGRGRGVIEAWEGRHCSGGISTMWGRHYRVGGASLLRGKGVGGASLLLGRGVSTGAAQGCYGAAQGR